MEDKSDGFRSGGLETLATALAKAQAEIKNAKMDSINPHFNSKYADLASIWEASRDALTKNGLSITQFTDILEGGVNEGEMVLVTMLMHSSGAWLKGRTLIRPVITTRKDKDDKTISVEVRNDPQGIGSQLTYLRRYAMAAIIGIAMEDDDGETTTATGEKVSTKTGEMTAPKEESSELATEKQVGWISRNFAALNWSEEALWKHIAEVNSTVTKLTDLKRTEASKLIDGMMKVKKEQEK